MTRIDGVNEENRGTNRDSIFSKAVFVKWVAIYNPRIHQDVEFLPNVEKTSGIRYIGLQCVRLSATTDRAM